jgi:ferritin-like metal-binding protein YciE
MKNGLHQLFLDELADIYDAENQLAKALPKLAKGAQSDTLRQVIDADIARTETHLSLLDQVFETVGASPKGKRCDGMKGAIHEAKNALSDHKGCPELDAALICAAQKAKHYEIASYGCLSTWANQMGHAHAFAVLKQILREQKDADHKLTEIAESAANMQAAQAA